MVEQCSGRAGWRLALARARAPSWPPGPPGGLDLELGVEIRLVRGGSRRCEHHGREGRGERILVGTAARMHRLLSLVERRRHAWFGFGFGFGFGLELGLG